MSQTVNEKGILERIIESMVMMGTATHLSEISMVYMPHQRTERKKLEKPAHQIIVQTVTYPPLPPPKWHY